MDSIEFAKFKGPWDNLGFPTGRARIPESERSPKKEFNFQDFESFNKFEEGFDSKADVESLRQNLLNCGKWYSFYFYCKKCLAEVKSEKQKLEFKPLDVKRLQAFCGIRYCSNPGCITDRYARIFTQLQNNERIQGLRKMLHFAIGFEKIDIKEFDVKRKLFERTIHNYIRRLKKVGVSIQAFKVLDISKGKRGEIWDGKYFVHYHFVAIPFKSGNNFYNILQKERMFMMAQQKVKVPFHVQIFGLKKKESLLSYISLRAVGLYKPFEFQKDKDFVPKKLREQIEAGEFMLLKDMFSLEDYMNLFFNRRFFSTIGGLPYGTKVRYNVSEFLPDSCPEHGDLSKFDVRIEVFPEDGLGPPPLLAGECVCVPVFNKQEGVWELGGDD